MNETNMITGGGRTTGTTKLNSDKKNYKKKRQRRNRNDINFYNLSSSERSRTAAAEGANKRNAAGPVSENPSH